MMDHTIRTATRADLVKLPGVTPAAADALLAQRTSKGRLTTHEDVRTALGLDAEKFERIKPYLYVKPEGR